MSVKFMAAVFAHDMPDLHVDKKGETRTVKASTAKLVLLALADHANDDGKSAYPSITTLGNKTAIRSRQTLSDTIDALAHHGYISKGNLSELGTTNYTLYMGALTVTTTVPPKKTVTTTEQAALRPPLRGVTTTVLKPSVKPSFNHHINNSKPELTREDIDPEGNPLKPKKPTKREREAIPKADQDAMVMAMGEVFGWDMKISSNYSRIVRDAQELIKAGYTPSTILRTYNSGGYWFKNDWRGKQGQRVRPKELKETIAEYSGKIAKANGHTPYDAAEMKRRAEEAMSE